MAKITPEQLDNARALIDVQGNSVRQAAEAIGVAESTLRYHLNGGKRASGRGVTQPLAQPDNPDERDPLLHDEGTPTIPVLDCDYSGKAHLRVYPMGDTHRGSPGHDEAKFLEWVAYLASQDDVSLILTGDLFNAALKTSVSEVYDEVETVDDALDFYVDALKPLKGKIDLMIPGNHDMRVYRAGSTQPVRTLAKFLEAPFAPVAALLNYKVGKTNYVAYVRHGTGNEGAGTLGGKANGMERGSKAVQADIYITGHTHAQVIARDRVLSVNAEGRSEWKRRLFVSAGSFVDYEAYAVERGFVAGEIGAPRIRLSGEKRDAHASL